MIWPTTATLIQHDHYDGKSLGGTVVSARSTVVNMIRFRFRAVAPNAFSFNLVLNANYFHALNKKHSGVPATCKLTRKHKIMNVFTQLHGMASTGNNICQTLFQGHVMWRWLYQNHDVYNCVAPLQTKSTKSLPLFSWRQTQFKRNKWVHGFLTPPSPILSLAVFRQAKLRYTIYIFLKPIMHLPSWKGPRKLTFLYTV